MIDRSNDWWFWWWSCARLINRNESSVKRVLWEKNVKKSQIYKNTTQVAVTLPFFIYFFLRALSPSQPSLICNPGNPQLCLSVKGFKIRYRVTVARFFILSFVAVARGWRCVSFFFWQEGVESRFNERGNIHRNVYMWGHGKERTCSMCVCVCFFL